MYSQGARFGTHVPASCRTGTCVSVIISNIVPVSFSPGGFLGKLANALAPQAPSPTPPPSERERGKSVPAPPLLGAGGAATGATLSPAALRAALLELGLSAGTANMALAQSLAQMGLPLTAAMLAEAGGALARAPGASPSSFALAHSLNLEPTPAILRALSAVTEGIPANRALPDEISAWLGLHLDMTETDPDTQSAHLHLMVNARAHSLENRLLSGTGGSPFHDARALLLRLAQNSGDRQTQRGADTLAAHMEGQQLVNAAAGHTDSRALLYFALPMSLPGENTMLELKLWPQDDAQDWENEADDADVFAGHCPPLHDEAGPRPDRTGGHCRGSVVLPRGIGKARRRSPVHPKPGTAVGVAGGLRLAFVCRVLSRSGGMASALARRAATGVAASARGLAGLMHKKEPTTAIALRYDAKGGDTAPRVVASGHGELAQHILTLAREHDIPLREDAALAGALAQMDVGASIPPELFRAVAEVLAFVYRMNVKA